MPELHTLLTGLAFGESPRWHEGRLWVADWGAKEILAVDREGEREVIVKVSFPSFPLCFDWLPDGHLLLVSSREGRVLRLESSGELLAHADLNDLAQKSCAIIKTSSIFSIAGVRAQKFVAQVAMAMFDVDKIETDLAGDTRRTLKLLDDSANFSVREQGKIAGQAESAIQNRMAVQNSWLRAIVRIRLAVAAGVRKLQANQQAVSRSCGSFVFRNQLGAQLRQACACMLCDDKLIGIRTRTVRDSGGFASPN